MALGIEDWINKTPAAKPDKLNIFIKAKPIIGPIITLPIEEITEFLNENTFSWVKATPNDINIRTIIAYANNITVFITNVGVSKSKYKKLTAVKIA